MRYPSRSTVKHVRRALVSAAILAAGLYLIPWLTLFFVICGVIDVSRHRKFRYELLEKYFMGNGIPTLILSPLNLLADLFSYRNIGVYRLEDLPAGHRAEIESCVQTFIANGDQIKQRVAETLGASKRGMLTFKWFNEVQETVLKIPAFTNRHRYIKTVAVSVFNTREQTSWHYGPMRLTFRVLYNLEPVASRDVFIEVDDKIQYWADDPLFIFDDTFFHRSTNNVDQVRYCLFMDIARPNYAQPVFDAAIRLMASVAAAMKTIFYKNWSFIR